MHILLHSVPPTLQQATTDPRLHWRLLDTHRQVWVSLLWGHCSFLRGPGTQGSVCALQGSISQSCVSSGSSTVGAYAIPICCIQSLFPCGNPLLTYTSTGDAQTQLCLSLCGVPESWCAQGLFEPSGSCAVLERRAVAVWHWRGREVIPLVQEQRRSPSKMVGGANSRLESNDIPARDTYRVQTDLVHTRTQGPHRD